MKTLKLLLFSWISMFSFCAVGQTEVNIKGKVMDLQHRPIPGVIVNNGINFTITDQKGAYHLLTDTAKCRYVRITVPSNCHVPVNELNLIEFYKPIEKQNLSTSYDFILKKREQVTGKFTYLVFSDPQPKDDFHFVRFFTGDSTRREKIFEYNKRRGLWFCRGGYRE